MAEQTGEKLIPGENTHENIIFACFGGLSNTGLTTAFASIEVVKELGLKKVGIGCLPGLPVNNQTVLQKTKVAKKVITVDGCPFECSRKVAETAGVKITKAIVLARDIGMKKMSLAQDIATGARPLAEYVSAEDVAKAKELIKQALEE